MPTRVQISALRRLPEQAVVVTESSRWANPFPVGRFITPAQAVARFRFSVENELPGTPGLSAVRQQLRGRDLACSCPPQQPCHADVLLELANQ